MACETNRFGQLARSTVQLALWIKTAKLKQRASNRNWSCTPASPLQLDVLNQWINILQSVQLPFAVIPLLLFTSDKRVMGSRFVNSRATTG